MAQNLLAVMSRFTGTPQVRALAPRVVLRGGNAGMALPVRVRNSDMAPGCRKHVRRPLVVDLDEQAWHGT